MNEQKHYITVGEILETMEESFGLSDWTTVKEELKTMQSPVNFTGKTAPTLSKDLFGRISLLSFFDEMEYAGEWLTVDDLKEYFKELDNDWGGVSWYEKYSDNTYNYSGYLERELNFCAFENDCTDEAIVFFAVHIGIDVRAGYTKYFAMKFDNLYEFEEKLSERFELAFLEYKDSDGDIQGISLYGSATSEYIEGYFRSDDSDFEEYIDVYDKETAIESLTEFMKDNEIDFIEGSLEVVE